MRIKKLYIHKDVAGTPPVEAIRSRLGLKGIRVADEAAVFDSFGKAADPIGFAKRSLILSRNRGAFIRDCPGTRHYNCCGYEILHIGSFCTMDCSYCILQTYFHPPALRFFVNHSDLLGELRNHFHQKGIHRIGTGEFTDSLIWENYSEINSVLVNEFGKQSRAVLELKTKTASIAGFRRLAHEGKTVLSWSLNTPAVVRREERGTASIGARLKAAAECIAWGYPVAFHFDPLILYEGWQGGYRTVLERLFAAVPSRHIVWISLGTFRFIPTLKPILSRRFARSTIALGEFIVGMDGKMRYFKPLRIEMYRSMVRWIRDLAPEVTVYLCMEDDEVWQKSLGFTPESKGGLGRILDRSAVQHCGLDPGP